MKKLLSNNFTLITLLISTLLFIKIHMVNNGAYASFQRSFDFLINVILFLCMAAAAYYIYDMLRKKKDNSES